MVFFFFKYGLCLIWLEREKLILVFGVCRTLRRIYLNFFCVKSLFINCEFVFRLRKVFFVEVFILGFFRRKENFYRVILGVFIVKMDLVFFLCRS